MRKRKPIKLEDLGVVEVGVVVVVDEAEEEESRSTKLHIFYSFDSLDKLTIFLINKSI